MDEDAGVCLEKLLYNWFEKRKPPLLHGDRHASYRAHTELTASEGHEMAAAAVAKDEDRAEPSSPHTSPTGERPAPRPRGVERRRPAKHRSLYTGRRGAQGGETRGSS